MEQIPQVQQEIVQKVVMAEMEKTLIHLLRVQLELVTAAITLEVAEGLDMVLLEKLKVLLDLAGQPMARTQQV